MVKIQASSAGGVGSTSGRGTKILHAVWPKIKRQISKGA